MQAIWAFKVAVPCLFLYGCGTLLATAPLGLLKMSGASQKSTKTKIPRK